MRKESTGFVIAMALVITGEMPMMLMNRMTSLHAPFPRENDMLFFLLFDAASTYDVKVMHCVCQLSCYIFI
jgi:hypothetical protein